LSTGISKKALNLRCVQVQRQHPVNPGFSDHVRNQLGGDRCTGLGAAILPGVAKVGDHGGDAIRRRPPQRVAHDQQLHQVVVGRVRGGLDDIHILAPHVFEHFNEDLLIVEPLDAGIDKVHRHAAMHRHPSCDGFGKGQVGITGNQFRFGHGGHFSLRGPDSDC
jgi:hypothetical protein